MVISYAGDSGGAIDQVYNEVSSQASTAVTPTPEPTFSGIFGGLEKWFYENVEQPIVGYVGTELAPLESRLGGIETSLEDIGPEISGLGTGIAGIAALAGTLVTEIPQVQDAIGVVRNELISAQDYITAHVDQGLSNIENYVMQAAIYEKDIANMAPTIQLIEGSVSEIPSEIENWWQSSAFPEIQGLFGDFQPEVTAIKSGLTEIEQGITRLGSEIEVAGAALEASITQLGSEIENLPQNIESYVEKGVDTELTKVWHKIELPVLAFGGIMLWKLFKPSCCTIPKKIPHAISGMQLGRSA